MNLLNLLKAISCGISCFLSGYFTIFFAIITTVQLSFQVWSSVLIMGLITCCLGYLTYWLGKQSISYFNKLK